MPVDDSNLVAKAQAVSTKLRATNTEAGELKRILRNIDSITLVDDPNNPGNKKDPVDRSLGSDMNPTRRQEIYDKILTDTSAQGL